MIKTLTDFVVYSDLVFVKDFLDLCSVLCLEIRFFLLEDWSLQLLQPGVHVREQLLWWQPSQETLKRQQEAQGLGLKVYFIEYNEIFFFIQVWRYLFILWSDRQNCEQQIITLIKSDKTCLCSVVMDGDVSVSCLVKTPVPPTSQKPFYLNVDCVSVCDELPSPPRL